MKCLVNALIFLWIPVWAKVLWTVRTVFLLPVILAIRAYSKESDSL